MSGKQSSTAVKVALQAATELAVAQGVGMPIALNADGGAPDWIMLLPAGNAGVISTVDGRGPYRVTDAAKLASTSLQAAGGQLPIDENHATDLAMPRGEPSPARAWVSELQSRADGIYGRVEWSKTGAELMAERAYRFISPALLVDKAGTIARILRASLVNTPNLRGMAALHAETNMDLLATLRKLLGLADDADEAAVIAAIEALNAKPAEDAALQAALAPIAKAAGLANDANATAIATAVTALATARPDAGAIVALQGELAAVTTQLNTLKGDGAKTRATTFVDGEIAKGRVGVKPLRDHYIAMHAADPARVEKEIGALPLLGASGALTTPPENKDGKVELSAEQLGVCTMLGIKPEDMQKTLAARQAH